MADLHPSALVDDIKGKNGDKTKNTVIAIGTVLLVVIAYLTLKHLQGAQAAAPDATPTSGNAGDVGTEGTAEDTDINGITSELGAENGVLSAGFEQLSNQLKVTNAKLKVGNQREVTTNKRLAAIKARLAKADKELAKVAPKTQHKAAKKAAAKKHTVDHNPARDGTKGGKPKVTHKPAPHKPVAHPKHPASVSSTLHVPVGLPTHPPPVKPSPAHKG